LRSVVDSGIVVKYDNRDEGPARDICAGGELQERVDSSVEFVRGHTVIKQDILPLEWGTRMVNRRNEQHISILDSRRNNHKNKNQRYKRRIDNKKLLFPIHVDRSKYETLEELYQGIKEWWVNNKNRSNKTIATRITNARLMARHPCYPVNWFTFDEEPEQVINQLMYQINVEYPKKAEETGIPTYGIHQIHNEWKTINTFAEAFGTDINWWGWSPPPRPDHKVKNIPRPKTVNKLIHNKYTNNRYTNALIRTLLTVGFHTGLRPGELITLVTKNVDFENGYIIITEQKKRYRNRQIWIDHSVMYSRQQNSIKNWLEIWRPRASVKYDGFIFVKEDGSVFHSEDALRLFLSKYCKPIWRFFCPKVMRDWNAIARLIQTKINTRKWDTREVTKALGHKYVSTTEYYIEFAEQYYQKDPYDWLHAVLKFHPSSKRMRRLMREEYGTSQKKDWSKYQQMEKNTSLRYKFLPLEFTSPRGFEPR